MQHYVDTVTLTRSNMDFRPCESYRAFHRRLKALGGNMDEQYCYAYRVLIGSLYAGYIGIAPHHTPDEMVKIIQTKTNIYDIETLTHTFTEVTYGQNVHATSAQVDRLCAILRTRLDA